MDLTLKKIITFIEKFRLKAEISRRIDMNQSQFYKKVRRIEGQRLLDKDVDAIKLALKDISEEFIEIIQ